ncbi:hypothetical protein FBR05_12035 [Deltaproteobacteria bacterium PRO3]|nr:hypothetical protein [Deltaproteobacteria bacterium PRO3]
MGACLEYLQLLGTSLGVNVTQNQEPSLRLDFNPEIGLGPCSRAEPRYENSPINLLLGLNAARWGEGLWQIGGTAGLRYNANRRVFYNLDLVLKAGAIRGEGGLEGAALVPALRLGLGWNALALEAGLLALGGGDSLAAGDRYAMLRVALPIYNVAQAVKQFSGRGSEGAEGNGQAEAWSARR